MKKTTLTTLAISLGLGASALSAQSVDLILDFPLISGDNTGTTSFDPITGIYSLTTTPRLIEVSDNTFQFVFPDTTTSQQNMSLSFVIDSVSGTVSGVPGNDFELIGSVDQTMDFIPDISGVLLTGEIIDFAYENNGTTDIYDFRFAVTGGLLAADFGSDDIGIINISENSNFIEDFTVPFTGEAKVTLGRVPPLPEPPVEEPVGPFEGLTPGYWKQSQHYCNWDVAGISLDSSFNVIFGVNAPGNLSLGEAIGKGGKTGALLRHATAALLNASHPNVSYYYTTTEILELVQYAFDTGEYEEVKNMFVVENELGSDEEGDWKNCSKSATSTSSESTSEEAPKGKKKGKK